MRAQLPSDGAVWYLGEDVFNYEDGVVAGNQGTWLAGRNGPGGMIMSADPQKAMSSGRRTFRD